MPFGAASMSCLPVNRCCRSVLGGVSDQRWRPTRSGSWQRESPPGDWRIGAWYRRTRTRRRVVVPGARRSLLLRAAAASPVGSKAACGGCVRRAPSHRSVLLATGSAAVSASPGRSLSRRSRARTAGRDPVISDSVSCAFGAHRRNFSVRNPSSSRIIVTCSRRFSVGHCRWGF
jgi:hypothetical protein